MPFLCFFSLTHHTYQPSVRKTHNTGRKHKDSVKAYYMSWLEQEAQHMIDQSKQEVLCITTGDNAISPDVQMHIVCQDQAWVFFLLLA